MTGLYMQVIENTKKWDVRLVLKLFTLWKSSTLLFLSFFFFFFLQRYLQHMEVPRLGVESELQLPAYTIACGNARSLTHCARPGIEPTSSWTYVGFSMHRATMGTPKIFMFLIEKIFSRHELSSHMLIGLCLLSKVLPWQECKGKEQTNWLSELCQNQLSKIWNGQERFLGVCSMECWLFSSRPSRNYLILQGFAYLILFRGRFTTL